MARVTVEDCILKVPNRFELVLLAAQRARQISAGLPITVERDNDKNPVVSLREIADETIKTEVLKENLTNFLQKYVESDHLEEEEEVEFDMMVGENLPPAPMAMPGQTEDEEEPEADSGDAPEETPPSLQDDV